MMGFSMLRYREKGNNRKADSIKMDYFLFKTTIPSFQYSIIPVTKPKLRPQKHPGISLSNTNFETLGYVDTA